MTRKVFCEKLAESRKSSGVKMKDICFAMNVMPTVIYRLEAGENNFSIDNALLYLKAIGYGLYLKEDNTNLFFFDCRENFSEYFKKLRGTAKLSQRDFASVAGVSYAVITGIESGKKNTAIDSLLLCLQQLNCQIIIKKRNE
ncbi:helix-turn-helix transcriptional regulator [Bacteroides sp. 224]|uniref:helix-turn-helix transcriptional regulator n=1 Tax=Bacteroides sp. 224 TaxID=2302936 RepID=UPI0013D776A3|nr:helix-turn-helix transcriptional regulator [Bacteroides sp. 224]NDV64015.1 helix-turn-helix domain-containing protein [Bacteroides sp. 224]